MKRDLLITLADSKYIDQAKQLFASVYCNAGWQGDYMLFAYDVPEDDLKWFKDKGILIKKCPRLPHTDGLRNVRRHNAVFSKFYLFSTEMKKWRNVVFLDADIIVRSSLNRLVNIEGLHAPNATNINLKKEFLYHFSELFKRLTEECPIKGRAFCSGVIAYNTDVIEEGSFSKLLEWVKKYGPLNLDGDEPTINLLFYKKWKMLPVVYNVYPKDFQERFSIRAEKINGIIIHFVESIKPWKKESYFYNEWIANLEKADSIDLNNRPPAKREWTNFDIAREVLSIRCRLAVHYPMLQVDRFIGLIGVLLRKILPNIYASLKKIPVFNRKKYNV